MAHWLKMGQVKDRFVRLEELCSMLVDLAVR